MVYCMADIHGETDRFHAMLELIQFSDDDVLYIIGDVIDRRSGGIDIIKEIMATPNMKMILGNHELMCLATLGPNNQIGAKECWLQNGGECTYHELLHLCSVQERNAILIFLSGLPESIDIEVKGQKYHLVHGFPSEDKSDVRLWGRPLAGDKAPIKDAIAVIGHTPTCFLTNNPDEVYRIWHGEGVIDIDCGCGHSSELRQLACLRLDDLQEFYI